VPAESETTATPSQAEAPPARSAPRLSVRCTRCGSLDVWRFGRVSSFQQIMANLRRGQWATCRKCGKRFISQAYGPMRREEDDDE